MLFSWLTPTCTRHDSVKLGDIETRVAHEAVPKPHDVKRLSHLTADLKQDSRCVCLFACALVSVTFRVLCRLLAMDRRAAAHARARETHVTLQDDR